MLDLYIRKRIVRLHERGKKYTEISRIIKEEEDKKVSRQAVSAIVTKWKVHQIIVNKPKSGRPPKLTLEIRNFIDQSMEENDELTSYGKIMSLGLILLL